MKSITERYDAAVLTEHASMLQIEMSKKSTHTLQKLMEIASTQLINAHSNGNEIYEKESAEADNDYMKNKSNSDNKSNMERSHAFTSNQFLHLLLLWMVHYKVMSLEQLSDLLQQFDRFHLHECDNFSDWTTIVSEKYLKMLSSEVSRLTLPHAETCQLTVSVALLINNVRFNTFLSRSLETMMLEKQKEIYKEVEKGKVEESQEQQQKYNTTNNTFYNNWTDISSIMELTNCSYNSNNNYYNRNYVNQLLIAAMHLSIDKFRKLYNTMLVLLLYYDNLHSAARLVLPIFSQLLHSSSSSHEKTLKRLLREIDDEIYDSTPTAVCWDILWNRINGIDKEDCVNGDYKDKNKIKTQVQLDNKNKLEGKANSLESNNDNLKNYNNNELFLTVYVKRKVVRSIVTKRIRNNKGDVQSVDKVINENIIIVSRGTASPLLSGEAKHVSITNEPTPINTKCTNINGNEEDDMEWVCVRPSWVWTERDEIDEVRVDIDVSCLSNDKNNTEDFTKDDHSSNNNNNNNSDAPNQNEGESEETKVIKNNNIISRTLKQLFFFDELLHRAQCSLDASKADVENDIITSGGGCDGENAENVENGANVENNLLAKSCIKRSLAKERKRKDRKIVLVVLPEIQHELCRVLRLPESLLNSSVMGLDTESIIRQRGWLPLHTLVPYINDYAQKRGKELPSNISTYIKLLLTEHDLCGRFEYGVYSLPQTSEEKISEESSSEELQNKLYNVKYENECSNNRSNSSNIYNNYNGINNNKNNNNNNNVHALKEGDRCVRARYAHTVPFDQLYLQILSQPETRLRLPRSLSNLAFYGFSSFAPRFAYFLIDEPSYLRSERVAKTSSIQVFEGRPFFDLFDISSLHKFCAYRNKFAPEERFDRKVGRGKRLLFVEVNLRALIRDEEHIAVFVDDRWRKEVQAEKEENNNECSNSSEKWINCYASSSNYTQSGNTNACTDSTSNVENNNNSDSHTYHQWYVFSGYHEEVATGLASVRSLKEFAFNAANQNTNLLCSISGKLSERSCLSSSLSSLSSSTSSLTSQGKKKCKFGGLPKFFLTGRIVCIGQETDHTMMAIKFKKEPNEEEKAELVKTNTTTDKVHGANVDSINKNDATGKDKLSDQITINDSNVKNENAKEEELAHNESKTEEVVNKDNKEILTFHYMHDHFIPRRCTLSHLLHDIIHDRVSERVRKRTKDSKSNNNNNTDDAANEKEVNRTVSHTSNRTEASQENNEKSSQDLQRKLQLLNTYKSLLKKETLEYMFTEIVEEEVEKELAKQICMDEFNNSQSNGVSESRDATDNNSIKNNEEIEESLSLYKPLPHLPFDLEKLKSEIVMFLRNEDEVELELQVPLVDANGNTFTDRTRMIDELKFCIKQHRLTYKLQVENNNNNNNNNIDSNAIKATESAEMALPQSSSAQYQVFVLTKPYLWSLTELNRVLSSLHLNNMNAHIRLLRTALTRESENKEDNYEIEEFIGDALMDYMVVFDTFLLKAVITYVEKYGIDYLQLNSVKKWLHSYMQKNNQEEEQELKEEEAELEHHEQHEEYVEETLNFRIEVNSHVCNNKVLHLLLPPLISSHFDRIYGDCVHFKVKADVFEALIGFIYDATGNLNQVRSFLIQLFSKLPRVLLHVESKRNGRMEKWLTDVTTETVTQSYLYDEKKNKCDMTCGEVRNVNKLHEQEDVNNEEFSNDIITNNDNPTQSFISHAEQIRVLTKALATCPYVYNLPILLRHLYNFNEMNIVDKDLQIEFDLLPEGATDAEGDGKVSKEENSHAAVSVFPRIQAKSYSTHFTSGPVCSYRRVSDIDHCRVFNRILSFYDTHNCPYINEIINNTTQLVIDFDGTVIQAWGGVEIIRRWATETFAHFANAAPAIMLLDCSGITTKEGKDKYKGSCHVHLPQISVDVCTMEKLQCHLRDYFSGWVAKSMHWVELWKTSEEGNHTNKTTGSCPEKELEKNKNVAVTPIFSDSFVRRELTSMRSRQYKLSDAQPKIWSYCTLEDLMALSHTCKAWRSSVLEHVMWMINEVQNSDNVEREERIAELAAIMGVNQTLAKEKELWEQRIVRFEGVKDAITVLEVKECTNIDCCCNSNEGNIESESLRVLVIETALRMPQPTPLVAPNWQTIWNDVIDPSLASSKKLRMFLNDKWDCVYGKQNRILYLDTLLPVDERHNNNESSTGSCEFIMGKKNSKSEAITLTEIQTNSENKWQTCILSTNGSGNNNSKKQIRKVELRVERPDKSFYIDTIERHAAKLVEYKKTTKYSQTQISSNGKQTDCTTVLNVTRTKQAKNEEFLHNDEEEEWNEDDDDDDDLEDENYPVLIAHASTLALTSLRCPQYRDVHGHVHDAWDRLSIDDTVANTNNNSLNQTDNEVKGSESDDDCDDHNDENIIANTHSLNWSTIHSVESDLLPSFTQLHKMQFSANNSNHIPINNISEYITTVDNNTTNTACTATNDDDDDDEKNNNTVFNNSAFTHVPCTSWSVWKSCLLPQTKKMVVTDDHAIPASLPTWWQYDASAQTTTFYVASEPVLEFRQQTCLAQTLKNAQGSGMEIVARYIIPHLNYSNVVNEVASLKSLEKSMLYAFLPE